MARLTVIDCNGWTSLAETAAFAATYNPATRQVRLQVGGDGGRSAVLDLDPPDAVALCNALMAAIHAHKVATKQKQPPPKAKTLRKQATKPPPIGGPAAAPARRSIGPPVPTG